MPLKCQGNGLKELISILINSKISEMDGTIAVCGIAGLTAAGTLTGALVGLTAGTVYFA